MTTDLQHLLSKLEAAEGPDRCADAEIHAFVLGIPEGWTYGPGGWILGHGDQPIKAPEYSGSLDAAVGLVPEGWSGGFEFGPTQNGVQFDANLWNGKFAPETCEVAAIAATPALALCIAALKAREQQG